MWLVIFVAFVAFTIYIYAKRKKGGAAPSVSSDYICRIRFGSPIYYVYVDDLETIHETNIPFQPCAIDCGGRVSELAEFERKIAFSSIQAEINAIAAGHPTTSREYDMVRSGQALVSNSREDVREMALDIITKKIADEDFFPNIRIEFVAEDIVDMTGNPIDCNKIQSVCFSYSWFGSNIWDVYLVGKYKPLESDLKTTRTEHEDHVKTMLMKKEQERLDGLLLKVDKMSKQ